MSFPTKRTGCCFTVVAMLIAVAQFGRNVAAEDQPKFSLNLAVSQAEDLSKAFQKAAKTVRPSVVSVSSVRKFAAKGRGSPQRPSGALRCGRRVTGVRSLRLIGSHADTRTRGSVGTEGGNEGSHGLIGATRQRRVASRRPSQRCDRRRGRQGRSDRRRLPRRDEVHQVGTRSTPAIDS